MERLRWIIGADGFLVSLLYLFFEFFAAAAFNVKCLHQVNKPKRPGDAHPCRRCDGCREEERGVVREDIMEYVGKRSAGRCRLERCSGSVKTLKHFIMWRKLL